jgi:COP9 signalosome complex subunit 2|uniref:PCI domain-containing protein n=1 Tax=Eutreptiella gymnastica TaxID=73025 RepID=A0A7S4C811_9EUGL
MDDDDECEFEYEEEDDYQIEDDGDEDMIDDDAEVEVENKYYNAKGEVDDCPKEAYNMLLEVLEREKENGSPGKWTFKALKQLVKCSFKLKKFDEMRQRYKELLEFSWPGLTRNHTEKAINKCLDVASTAGAQVLQSLYEITLERLGKDTKNQEKLWFNIKLKLANLFFETRDFNVLRGMVTELKNWCRDADGSYDVKKGTQLLTVYSLEIQMQTELKDYKTLKTLYSESLEVESAIPPPRILGIIRECGGKMFMRQGNWEDANSAFFQAFKNYDEAGHPRRIQCLKYLVLANMLASSNINPFDSTEAKPYKNDTEIVAMTDLIDAYGCNDIKRFERILKDNRSTIVDDPFIKGYIDPLLKTIRTQVLLDICKPYTRIRIPFISQELNIVDEEVEALLVGLILDNRLVGFIDQVNQLLHLGGSTTQGSRYQALQKWTAQIGVIHSTLCSRIG